MFTITSLQDFIFFTLFLPPSLKMETPQTCSGFYISVKNVSCSYSIFQIFFHVFFPNWKHQGFVCLHALSKPDNIEAQGLFPKLLCLLYVSVTDLFKLETLADFRETYLQQCVVSECRHAGLKQWLWMHLSQLHHKTNDKHIHCLQK